MGPALLLLLLQGPYLLAQPTFDWAKSAGGTNHDWAASVAVDALGNCYVTGESLSPVIWFGALALTNQGNRAVLAAKYDPAGNLLWATNTAQVAPGVTSTRGVGVTADGAGGCYVGGLFSGTVRWGATEYTSGGLADAFLARHGANGQVLWLRRAGGTNALDLARGYRVAADAAGGVLFAGEFQGEVSFSNTAGTNATLTGQGVFLAKYDAAGHLVWLRAAHGNLYPAGLTRAGDGSIFLGGDFSSDTAVFGATTLTNGGFDNGFVARYTTQGSLQWVKQIGGTISDRVVDVAADAAGNVVAACYLGSGDAQIGGGPNTNGPFVLARFAAAGNLTLTKSTPLIGRLAIGPAGEIVMTGEFDEVIVFGSTTLTNTGTSQDIFVCQFDVAGNPVWARQAGGPNQDVGRAVAVSSAGDIYVAGEFQAIATFGSLQLTNAYLGGDVFVTRLMSAAPKLNIALQANQAVLTWPVSALNFQLEASPNLTSPSWQTVTNVPVIVGDQYTVTNALNPATRLFRLKRP